ncbi:sensor histidine kinase [Microbacterium sp. NPDC055910]|uniref:sensor histidine kinase n=1 Tax=Microbacterium sp. NPDC055910 TaxID=3345659 RepID=UPI0035D90A5B
MTDAAAPAPPTGRRPWTLQNRLIGTVVAIVSLILVLVAVAMSAILGTVLEQRLNAQLTSTANRTALWIGPMLSAGMTAADVLRENPQPAGSLLAISSPFGEATAAVVQDDGTVATLDDDQISQIAQGLRVQGPIVASIDDVGTYRLEPLRAGATVVLVGLSRADVATTIGQMLTTITLLTLGGLMLLSVATAWTIRVGLAPLRAVADTAARVSALPLAEGAVSLTERVPAAQADPRTEVGRVGEALNTMLDHVAVSLDARQRNEERMRAFVADASHELRTPLASIRGYSELSLRALRQAQGPAVAQGPGGAPEVTGIAWETTEASLERIQAQSLRMTALVEDLLLLARLDEGQELVYGSVDLSRLVIDATGDAQAAASDHEWSLDLDENPVVVAGDAGRLTQVVANLLANARIHTPEGTHVAVSVRHDGREAVVSVHDDGPGIDPAVADELFQRFSRGDRSRARQTGGTGLGLSIAQAIARAHGGTLSVRSAPGDTTFELRLPAARPADPHADPATTPAQ